MKKMIWIINQNAEKLIILVNIHCSCFLRDIHEWHLSLEDTDLKWSNFAIALKNFDKSMKKPEKKYFLNNLGLLLSARKKVLNGF